jgi:hypothetical protein
MRPISLIQVAAFVWIGSVSTGHLLFGLPAHSSSVFRWQRASSLTRRVRSQLAVKDARTNLSDPFHAVSNQYKPHIVQIPGPICSGCTACLIGRSVDLPSPLSPSPSLLFEDRGRSSHLNILDRPPLLRLNPIPLGLRLSHDGIHVRSDVLVLFFRIVADPARSSGVNGANRASGRTNGQIGKGSRRNGDVL